MSILDAALSERPRPGELWTFSLAELLVFNVATRLFEPGSGVSGNIEGIVLSCEEKTYADSWTSVTVTFMNNNGIYETSGDAYTVWGTCKVTSE